MPMRPALEVYLKEQPNIKAIWIGTRRVDPNGGQLTHFDYTDKDWPQFMRIHPVIVSFCPLALAGKNCCSELMIFQDWHYAEIWAVSSNLVLLMYPTVASDS